MPSGGSNKFTLDQVTSICESHGFILLSAEYKSNNAKLNVACPCGETAQMRLSAIQRGNRCLKCRIRNNSLRFRTTNETMSQFCDAHGCKFVSSEIKNRRTRMRYICKCGDSTEAYWSNFQRYPNCKKCGNKKVSGENSHMWNEDREEVARRKRFRKTCERLIRRVMEATGGRKADRSASLLGYTPEQLQEHILSHPNMASLQGKEWHVDHIFPIQAFLDHGIEDLRLINALGNLQPLESTANIHKADTYDHRDFEEWVEAQKNAQH